MKLESVESIWGIPLEIIKKEGKKGSLLRLVLDLLDVAIVIGLVTGFSNSLSLCMVLVICIALALITTTITVWYINEDMLYAYDFYKRNRKREIEYLDVYITKDKLGLLPLDTVFSEGNLDYILDLIRKDCFTVRENAKTYSSHIKSIPSDKNEYDCIIRFSILNKKKSSYLIEANVIEEGI